MKSKMDFRVQDAYLVWADMPSGPTLVESRWKTRVWPEGKVELEAYPDDLPPTSTP